jgi:hypothetical protein
MAFQSLARPYFCLDQTPWQVNFTVASEMASGPRLANSNSSMAAMSRARLYGDEPVRTQFPKFPRRGKQEKQHENSYCDH